jgi:hypothetical protein
MIRMASRSLLTVLAITVMLLMIDAMFGEPASFAQEPTILASAIGDLDPPLVDGSWSTSNEWITASEVFQNYTDQTELIIRALHDETYLYILLEMPQDHVVDGRASICFDTLNDGGAYMKPDDVCFVLGQNLEEFHGNGRTNLMQETVLVTNVDARRGLSGADSPHHSDGKHVTYEFKVPIDYVGNFNQTQFGFYAVFDTREEATNYTDYYSWPDYETSSSLRVAPPRGWGILSISSMTEVPEFPLPILGIMAGVMTVIVLTKKVRVLRQ